MTTGVLTAGFEIGGFTLTAGFESGGGVGGGGFGFGGEGGGAEAMRSCSGAGVGIGVGILEVRKYVSPRSRSGTSKRARRARQQGLNLHPV